MNRQEYMDQLSKALESFDSDIKDEIFSDYEEHFNDGLANGKTEEQIIGELGSIDDLVKELKDLNSGNDANGRNSSFEKEAKKTIEDATKAFANFLGTMAAGIMGGAEKVTNGASDYASTFADGLSDGLEKAANGLGKAADAIANGTIKFAKDVSDSYKGARGTTTADTEKEEADDDIVTMVSFSDCTEVIADTDCADIIVEQAGGDEVTFDCDFDATPSQKLAYIIEYKCEDGKAYATIKKKDTFSNFFGKVKGPEALYIKVPSSVTRIKLNALSGDIECADITSKRVDVNTMSGDIELRNFNIQDLYAKSMSGDVDAEDIHASIVDLQSMSGDVEFEGIAGNLHIASTSGDVEGRVSGARKVKATSVSGDVDISLEGVDGYTVEADSKSGEIDLFFGEEEHEDVRRGSYTFGSGAVEVTANSVSGDVKVEA